MSINDRAYRKHSECDESVRDISRECRSCFRENFGDLLAHRRCWYCATDSFSWANFTIVQRHLACGQCAQRVKKGDQHFVRSASIYRARKTSRMEPTWKQSDMYYHLKDFKDHLEELDYLVVPLGNILERSIQRLVDQEGLILQNMLIVPAPSSSPERDHMKRMLAHAAKSLPGANIHYDLLRSSAGTSMKGLGLAERESRSADSIKIRGDVRRRTVIIADDFYTSGITLNVCAEALRKAGAQSVYGATVARVVNRPAASSLSQGSVLSMVRWEEIGDQGKVALDKVAQLIFQMGCSKCHRTVTSHVVGVQQGKQQSPLLMKCQCGATNTITFAWQLALLVVTPEGRRSSEVIFARIANSR
jgi:predicted amidophosphoribosyltransferase